MIERSPAQQGFTLQRGFFFLKILQIITKNKEQNRTSTKLQAQPNIKHHTHTYSPQHHQHTPYTMHTTPIPTHYHPPPHTHTLAKIIRVVPTRKEKKKTFKYLQLKWGLDNILKFYFWLNFTYHVKCNC